MRAFARPQRIAERDEGVSDLSSTAEQRTWVGLSGDLVVARVRGTVTEEEVSSAQEQVLRLLDETQRSQVLYDALEMEPPSINLTLVQRGHSDQLYRKGVRIAILVPDTRTAFLARLAFGQGDYRVIYNDRAEALAWLTHGDA
ncbi:MAG: hypothetical protein JWN69_2020 [Alphaproteobacteria bacterium]|nr:hypothetical protein [Alphaproteobacteria bacterium]